MKVNYNGTWIETGQSTLQTLLDEKLISGKSGIAVAVNNNVVLKSNWSRFELSENDHILVITAAAGG